VRRQTLNTNTHTHTLQTIDTSDTHPAQADCTILVVALDALLKEDQCKELSNAQQLIVLVNKMYSISPTNLLSAN
jgi:hypothetical protein